MVGTTTFLVGEERTVYLVHEDSTLSRTLKPLIQSLGLRLTSLGSAEELSCCREAKTPGCILFNLISGEAEELERLGQLRSRGIYQPVVVLSASGEVPLVVRAMRAGARDFLKRPCSGVELAKALSAALAWDAENRRHLAERLRLQRRVSRLTVGERDVLRLLVDGRSNQAIATALGISVRAVEVRRAKLMQKMQAESLAELVRMTLLAVAEPVEAAR
jgi:FixJ family two-component response regulator